MRRKLDLSAVIVLMASAAALTYLITLIMVTNNYNTELTESKRTQRVLAKYLEAREHIEKNYIGSSDEEKLLDGSTDGLVGSLGDEWSCYLDISDYERVTGAKNGVGIGITAVYNREAGGLRIGTVYEDSPAADVELCPGDIITAIDGVKTTSVHAEIAMSRVYGAENTPMELTVFRPSNEKTFTVTAIRRAVAARSVTSRILDGGIGLVRLYSFDEGADIAFVEAVENLKAAGVRGLILDVRSNAGGQLRIMLSMLDQLIGEGDMITRRSKSGKEEPSRSNAAELELPMVTVQNTYTAAAAEYFAGALREYNKAMTIGEKTAGKGYQEVVIPLSDGSGLILSTSEYLLPSGRSLNETGLEPDYPVEVTPGQAADIDVLDPADDPQIAKAIQVLRIQIPQTGFDLSDGAENVSPLPETETP
ncbi:peptidase S41 [Clostridia bacterium]|nr:peptidase S41 [Clostridia bacterium]